jgi:hypothetical protein
MVVIATSLCRNHPHAGEILHNKIERTTFSISPGQAVVSASFVYYNMPVPNEITSIQQTLACTEDRKHHMYYEDFTCTCKH